MTLGADSTVQKDLEYLAIIKGNVDDASILDVRALVRDYESLGPALSGSQLSRWLFLALVLQECEFPDEIFPPELPFVKRLKVDEGMGLVGGTVLFCRKENQDWQAIDRLVGKVRHRHLLLCDLLSQLGESPSDSLGWLAVYALWRMGCEYSGFIGTERELMMVWEQFAAGSRPLTVNGIVSDAGITASASF